MRLFSFSFPASQPLRVLLLANAITLVADAMIGPIYALFVDEIGGDLLDASLAGATFALAAGITVLFAGVMSDRSSHPERIIALGYACIGLGYFCYIFVGSMSSLLAVQALIGFGQAVCSPPFDALYSRYMDMKYAGRAWGVSESMAYFSIAAGAAIGGLTVRAFGFQALFLVMSVLCFLAVGYVLTLPHGIRGMRLFRR